MALPAPGSSDTLEPGGTVLSTHPSAGIAPSGTMFMVRWRKLQFFITRGEVLTRAEFGHSGPASLTHDGGLSGDFLWSLGLDVWLNKEGSTVVAQTGFVMSQAAETMAQLYRECSSRHPGAAVILLFFISNTYALGFL